jgi:hypothetical protein
LFNFNSETFRFATFNNNLGLLRELERDWKLWFNAFPEENLDWTQSLIGTWIQSNHYNHELFQSAFEILQSQLRCKADNQKVLVLIYTLHSLVWSMLVIRGEIYQKSFLCFISFFFIIFDWTRQGGNIQNLKRLCSFSFIFSSFL